MALREQLGCAAGALGENEEETLVLEEAIRVFREAREHPCAVGHPPQERYAVDELLRHPLCESRWIHVEEARHHDHRGVDCYAPGMIAYQHRAAPGGHVLDAARRDREVPPVKGGEGRPPEDEVLLGDAVGIETKGVEREVEAVDCIADLLVDSHGEGAQDTRFTQLDPAAASPPVQREKNGTIRPEVR